MKFSIIVSRSEFEGSRFSGVNLVNSDTPLPIEILDAEELEFDIFSDFETKNDNIEVVFELPENHFFYVAEIARRFPNAIFGKFQA